MSTFSQEESHASCGPTGRKKKGGMSYGTGPMTTFSADSRFEPNQFSATKTEPETVTHPFIPASALKPQDELLPASSKEEPQNASSHLCTTCGQHTQPAETQYVSLYEATNASAKSPDAFTQLYSSGMPPDSTVQTLVTK